MLLYNNNKEFIGINNDDLRRLDLDSFSDLLKECSDFADLFIKKPGYVHNFKNFKWIDFVMHSEEESKVLISLAGKTYTANLKISIIHLIESPAENSYYVELVKLHRLNSSGESIDPTEFETSHHIPTALPSFDDVEPTTLVEPDPLDVPNEPMIFDTPETPDLSIYNPESSFLNDTPSKEPKEIVGQEEEISIPMHDEPTIKEVVPPTPVEETTKAKEAPMLGDHISPKEQAYIDHLETSVNYQYNPQVAADELGLPVDLIEEFIGDFILQSYEFHDELFQSVNEHNFDNLKNLSHKLKGVAANLRIEDSFEVLNVVNTTHDIDEAEAYLKYFYNTIAKLEGKDVIYNEIDNTETSSSATLNTDDNFYESDAETEKSTESLEEPEPSLEADENELYALDPIEKDTHTDNTTETIDDDELYALDVKEDVVEIEKSFEAEEELVAAEEQAVDFNEPIELEEEPFNPIELTLDEDATDKEVLEPTTSIDVKDIHYDSKASAYILGIDDAFMQELKDDFINHALEQKDALQDALQNADTAKYKQIALELKGISDNLRINDISVTLEELIKSSTSKEASQHVNQFFHYLVQL
ncbi:MAG: hypothetical protein U9P71_00285 [Campylobacterota bacterium]|nr:hypothetical protein [Campylobacterota bacterium]